MYILQHDGSFAHSDYEVANTFNKFSSVFTNSKCRDSHLLVPILLAMFVEHITKNQGQFIS